MAEIIFHRQSMIIDFEFNVNGKLYKIRWIQLETPSGDPHPLYEIEIYHNDTKDFPNARKQFRNWIVVEKGLNVYTIPGARVAKDHLEHYLHDKD